MTKETRAALFAELKDIVERSPGSLRGYIDAHSAARIGKRKARALEIIEQLSKES